MPDSEARRALLTLFGEAAMCAADRNNSAWHVSLQKEYGVDSTFIDPDYRDAEGLPLTPSSPHRLRLVAGACLVATFHGDGFIAWAPRESLTEEMIARVEEEGGIVRELGLRSIPENPVSLRITPDLIDWYRENIQPIFFEYIRKTGAKYKKSPWAKSHRADVVDFINRETGLDIPQPDYYKAMRPIRHWWLNCNPGVWDLGSLAPGEEKAYTAYNENGNKRRIYRHMPELRPGDLVVGYETSPRKTVTALLEITRPLTPTDDNEEFVFRKLIDLSSPVPYGALSSNLELKNSEPALNNYQGSLFSLTPEEFTAVADLAGVDLDSLTETAVGGEGDANLARRVQEAIAEPIAVNSFETRREFEGKARKMLDEMLGEMTSEDIREFLDLLVTSRRDGDSLIRSRFAMALSGSLAQMIASDPEAFNKWIGLLWESDATNGLENFERFRKSGEVKGAGVSLPSIVLYLKDPETFGISIGVMIRALKELAYDVPKKTTTAQEYGQYLTALHAFRTAHDLEPVMMDYVLWKLMEEDRTIVDGPVDDDMYTLSKIAAETNIPESTLKNWIAAIERKGQAILYGPPGTGKTYVAKRLAKYLSTSGGRGLVQTIQFHPAYGYEDFIRGIRPRTDEETDELEVRVRLRCLHELLREGRVDGGGDPVCDDYRRDQSGRSGAGLR